jgi:predicted transcriptional regulator
MNNSINWRRSKVMELSSQGYSQSDIAKILQISQPTISRDISYLEEQARFNIKKYIDKKLPFEYDKCMAALNSLQKRAWEISEKSIEEKTQVQALSLAKDCIINKLDLLTNATVVDDAMKFISSKSKENLKSSSNDNENDKESNEPDYGGDKEGQLQEKQEEKERGQINQITITTNEIF